MGLDLNYINGQPPIDEDEKEGLLIETIATNSELNEFEQLNIEEALQWVFGRKFKAQEVFRDQFIRDLHKQMFGDVWAWAGKFRKTNKNIGIENYQIPVALKVLCDDALFWMNDDTYPPEEIAIRFKHRIVSIHCFPNGNGRHSRLMGDIIIEKIYGHEPFSWGAGNIVEAGKTRADYLAALRAADQGDYTPLLAFSRS